MRQVRQARHVLGHRPRAPSPPMQKAEDRMIEFGEQFDFHQEHEEVRPGERLLLRDVDRRIVVVRGRDRKVKWKMVALVWMAASILHLIGGHLL